MKMFKRDHFYSQYGMLRSICEGCNSILITEMYKVSLNTAQPTPYTTTIDTINNLNDQHIIKYIYGNNISSFNAY